MRRFANWLVEEGEVDLDPLIGVKAPKLDRTVIEPLTDVQGAAQGVRRQNEPRLDE
jgi:site-specific recombinase XerC